MLLPTAVQLPVIVEPVCEVVVVIVNPSVVPLQIPLNVSFGAVLPPHAAMTIAKPHARQNVASRFIINSVEWDRVMW